MNESMLRYGRTVCRGHLHFERSWYRQGLHNPCYRRLGRRTNKNGFTRGYFWLASKLSGGQLDGPGPWFHPMALARPSGATLTRLHLLPCWNGLDPTTGFAWLPSETSAIPLCVFLAVAIISGRRNSCRLWLR